MKFETAIIARRFTIICLIAMNFGFVFANLVVSRPAHSYEIGLVTPCIFENGHSCTAR